MAKKIMQALNRKASNGSHQKKKTGRPITQPETQNPGLYPLSWGRKKPFPLNVIGEHFGNFRKRGKEGRLG